MKGSVEHIKFYLGIDGECQMMIFDDYLAYFEKEIHWIEEKEYMYNQIGDTESPKIIEVNKLELQKFFDTLLRERIRCVLLNDINPNYIYNLKNKPVPHFDFYNVQPITTQEMLSRLSHFYDICPHCGVILEYHPKSCHKCGKELGPSRLDIYYFKETSLFSTIVDLIDIISWSDGISVEIEKVSGLQFFRNNETSIGIHISLNKMYEDENLIYQNLKNFMLFQDFNSSVDNAEEYAGTLDLMKNEPMLEFDYSIFLLLTEVYGIMPYQTLCKKY